MGLKGSRRHPDAGRRLGSRCPGIPRAVGLISTCTWRARDAGLGVMQDAAPASPARCDVRPQGDLFAWHLPRERRVEPNRFRFACRPERIGGADHRFDGAERHPIPTERNRLATSINRSSPAFPFLLPGSMKHIPWPCRKRTTRGTSTPCRPSGRPSLFARAPPRCVGKECLFVEPLAQRNDEVRALGEPRLRSSCRVRLASHSAAGEFYGLMISV